MDKIEKSFGDFWLNQSKYLSSDDQIFPQDLSPSPSDSELGGNVLTSSSSSVAAATGREEDLPSSDKVLYGGRTTLRGILKRREPVAVGGGGRGRGRFFSESQIDEFSTTPTAGSLVKLEREEQGRAGGSSGGGSQKCVHFSETVRQQLYRVNSSILGQAEKNRRKAAKKRRAADRRKSEGDAQDEAAAAGPRFQTTSVDLDDSGLGSCTETTINDHGLDDNEDEVGGDELEDSLLSRSSSEQEETSDSGLCSSIEEGRSIEKGASGKRKKKKSARKAVLVIPSETSQFEILVRCPPIEKS